MQGKGIRKKKDFERHYNSDSRRYDYRDGIVGSYVPEKENILPQKKRKQVEIKESNILYVEEGSQ